MKRKWFLIFAFLSMRQLMAFSPRFPPPPPLSEVTSSQAAAAARQQEIVAQGLPVDPDGEDDPVEEDMAELVAGHRVLLQEDPVEQVSSPIRGEEEEGSCEHEAGASTRLASRQEGVSLSCYEAAGEE